MNIAATFGVLALAGLGLGSCELQAPSGESTQSTRQIVSAAPIDMDTACIEPAAPMEGTLSEAVDGIILLIEVFGGKAAVTTYQTGQHNIVAIKDVDSDRADYYLHDSTSNTVCDITAQTFRSFVPD